MACTEDECARTMASKESVAQGQSKPGLQGFSFVTLFKKFYDCPKDCNTHL